MFNKHKLTSLMFVAFIATCVGTVAFSQDFKPRPLTLNGKDYAFEVLTTRDGKDYGYFDPISRWPSEEDGTTIIFVCWENYSNRFKKEHQEVHDAVIATWQQHSKIEFRGWQPCADRSSGIRIYVSEEGPHTKGLGRWLDGQDHGMVLNFTFNTWSSEFCNSSPQMRDYCIKGIAVHEFGHAIGFAHEQNRPDKPGECQEPAQGPSEGAVMLTPYDPQSVMNYCNNKYNNDGKLSALDVDALHKVYGTK